MPITVKNRLFTSGDKLFSAFWQVIAIRLTWDKPQHKHLSFKKELRVTGFGIF